MLCEVMSGTEVSEGERWVLPVPYMCRGTGSVERQILGFSCEPDLRPSLRRKMHDRLPTPEPIAQLKGRRHPSNSSFASIDH